MLGLLFSCEKNIKDVELPITDDFVSGELGETVPGQFIVLLNDGAIEFKSTGESYQIKKEFVQKRATDVLNTLNIPLRELKQVYAATVNGFTIELEENEASLLKQDASVMGVWPDRVFILKNPGTDPTDPPSESIPYGVARVGYGNYTGSHSAWIIDTGIDLDHADLNVDASRSATFVDRTSTADDDNGHGTHCAGIVAAIDNEIGVIGVAAGATVVPVKVLNKRGSGTMSAIIAGVDWVGAHAVPGDAANMSLGGGIYEPLDIAVQNLGASGIYVSLAAGNESDDANNHTPARANGTNLYTISACDASDYFASFSNYGNPPIDYCAPGVSILSTYKGGAYATMSGTSMSAPHVCGLLLATNGSLNTDGYVQGDPDGNPDPIAHR